MNPTCIVSSELCWKPCTCDGVAPERRMPIENRSVAPVEIQSTAMVRSYLDADVGSTGLGQRGIYISWSRVARPKSYAEALRPRIGYRSSMPWAYIRPMPYQAAPRVPTKNPTGQFTS